MQQPRGEPEGQMTAIVERNIAALREEARRRQAAKGLAERIADAITGFTGSMTFVVLHVALFGAGSSPISACCPCSPGIRASSCWP